jgi:hypothetical protein
MKKKKKKRCGESGTWFLSRGREEVSGWERGAYSLVFYPIDGPNDGDRYGPEGCSQGRSESS